MPKTNCRALREYRFHVPDVVAVGDTHFPFVDRRWLDWAVEEIANRQPEYIVQVGDLYDYFALSRYSKILKITAEEEAVEGRAAAEEMWARFREVSPDSKCFQIRGNHDDRDGKALADKCPELAPFVDLKDRFIFDGVETIHDSKEELWLEDVAVLHGYKSHGAHARHNQAPTIVGHSHTGGVSYFQNRFGTYWELNAGFGGDINSPVFHYRNQKKLHGWTLGLGAVDRSGPRFIPYSA
jgi:hypothetical protein